MEIKIGSKIIIGAIRGIRNALKKVPYDYRDDALVCPKCRTLMRLINPNTAKYQGYYWLCPNCPETIELSPKTMQQIKSKIRIFR